MDEIVFGMSALLVTVLAVVAIGFLAIVGAEVELEYLESSD